MQAGRLPYKFSQFIYALKVWQALGWSWPLKPQPQKLRPPARKLEALVFRLFSIVRTL